MYGDIDYQLSKALHFHYNWGEPERAPHLLYCCAKSSYIYMYMCAVRPSICTASNLAPRRAPLNAQRANVGPPSKGSKVNNIALKTTKVKLQYHDCVELNYISCPYRAEVADTAVCMYT